MTEAPGTYSGRRRVIAEMLDPFFGVDSMVPTNTESAFEPGMNPNSLVCSWADDAARPGRTLSVFIDSVTDGARKAADVRDMIEQEALPTPDGQPADADAYELPSQHVGEYAFVLNYLGRLTVISGNCVVQIMPWPISAPLDDLANLALEVARTVGCSEYVDDLIPPTTESGSGFGAWSTADGFTYDPRTPPTQ